MKKKKLSNFVLFPLVLGTTCIVCAGTLAAVNYAVHGTIEGNKTKNITKKIGTFFKDYKSYKIIYEKGNAEVVDEEPIVETPAEFDSHIVRCYRVKTHDDQIGLVYQATTESGYSGNLDVVVGVFKGAVIGLAQLGGSEDTLGINAVNKFSSYLSWDHMYAAGDDFKAMTTASGASAQATFPVLQSTLDILLADEPNRVKVASGSISSEVSVSIVSNDISTVKLEATATSDNKYAAMKAEIVMNIEDLSLIEAPLTSVTIKDYDGSEAGNAGDAVIKGTATDNFTKNYVLANNDKLNLRSFRKTLAKAEEGNIFEGCAAPETAKGYYLLMNGIYNYANNNANDFSNVKKISDTEYQVLHMAGNIWESVVLTATVDKAKSVFTEVKVDKCGGTDGYGQNIVNSNLDGFSVADKVEAATNFINNYVKIPAEGLSFDKFRDEMDPKGNVVSTGATFTSYGYYTALHSIVVAINEEK
ncbi:MAG TPA: hypothetical protein DCY93_02740 [Firmicutes bacterium]|nr:hypothetical protein [Bacillota bacterium]